MRIASLVALLMAMLFLLGPAGTSSAAEPADPVTVVENFLLGRDMADFWGAAGDTSMLVRADRGLRE